jgi:hypothetical protein
MIVVTKAEASTAKTARICWKSGVRTGHTRFFYPLRLLKQRGLMVQLPYLFMPFDPRPMGLRKEIMLFGLSFDNVERNDANRKALEFLQELDERCKALVESKEVVISWVPLLLPTNRGFPPFCRLSCHNPNKTLAFNAEKETIRLDNLSGKVYARVILSFDGVWLNTSTKQSGIDANVVQVQVQLRSQRLCSLRCLQGHLKLQSHEPEDLYDPVATTRTFRIWGHTRRLLLWALRSNLIKRVVLTFI